MKKMNLVFDIGNTHVVGGLYQSDKKVCSWRWKTDIAKTEDEYYQLFFVLVQAHDIADLKINQIAVCSVVPNLTRTFEHLFQKYFSCPYEIISAYSDLGLEFPMADPGFIGADLVINAFSAKEKYKKTCLICDFGTATTIQLVRFDGYFFGTVIAPGLLTSAGNLFSKASQLANIELKPPQSILGINTPEAIRSGIIFGNAYMVDGFIQSIREEYAKLSPIFAIATGGMASMIGAVAKTIDWVDTDLTLEGLNRYCMRK